MKFAFTERNVCTLAALAVIPDQQRTHRQS